MKVNKWTVGLAAMGVISLPSVAMAEEGLTAVMSSVATTTLSGYVSASAIWLTGSNSSDPMGPNYLVGRSFDGSDKQDGFNLDVVSLTLEKPLDESQWSAGYKAQLWIGPDANTLNSLSVNSIADGASDFAIKNAYVALRAPVGNGLDFKVGVWDTVVGYEVADSPMNPNYSRSFGFYIEPIIHTGILASYRATDWFSLSAGVANGMASRAVVNNINTRSSDFEQLSYLGNIALTAPESMGFLKGATLYGGIVNTGVTGIDDVINFYGGVVIPTPIDKLSIGAAYDYRANGLFNESYENAAAAYLSYQLTEKLRLNARGEYATGSNGAYGVSNPDSEKTELLGVTGTIDYSLWANAITRLEVRWDYDLSENGIFLDGEADNALSVALNVIYKF